MRNEENLRLAVCLIYAGTPGPTPGRCRVVQWPQRRRDGRHERGRDAGTEWPISEIGPGHAI